MTAEPIEPGLASLWRGLWRRLLMWLGLERVGTPTAVQPEPIVEPEPEPEPLPGPLQTRREGGPPIAVPAQGAALSFLLDVVYHWHSDGLDQDAHREWVTYHGPKVRRDIRLQGRALAASIPPHHVEAMQAAMNKWIDAMSWRFDRDEIKLSCRARVSVAPDDQIRDRLVDHWKRLIDIDNENELSVRRADLAGDLTKRWSAILGNLQNDPMAAPAARMTEQQLATVVGDLSKGQTGAMRELIDLLEQLKSGKSMGQYEFIELFDTVIKKLREQQGL